MRRRAGVDSPHVSGPSARGPRGRRRRHSRRPPASARPALSWLARAAPRDAAARGASRRASGPTCSTPARARACAARSGRCAARSATASGTCSWRRATRSASAVGPGGLGRACVELSPPRATRRGALELGDGALLAGFDDEWVLRARDEHRERLDGGARRLRRRPSERGEPAAASRSTAAGPRSTRWRRRPRRADAPPGRAGDRPAALGGLRAAARAACGASCGLSPSPATRAAGRAVRAAPIGAGRRRAGGASAAERRQRHGRARARCRRSPAATPSSTRCSTRGALARGGAGGASSCTARAGSARPAWPPSCSTAPQPTARRGGAAPRSTSAAPPRSGCGPSCSASWRARSRPRRRRGRGLARDLGRLAPGSRARCRPAPTRRRRVDGSPELERARLFEAVVELLAWAAAEPAARAPDGGRPPRRRAQPRARRLRRPPAAATAGARRPHPPRPAAPRRGRRARAGARGARRAARPSSRSGRSDGALAARRSPAPIAHLDDDRCRPRGRRGEGNALLAVEGRARCARRRARPPASAARAPCRAAHRRAAPTDARARGRAGSRSPAASSTRGELMRLPVDAAGARHAAAAARDRPARRRATAASASATRSCARPSTPTCPSPRRAELHEALAGGARARRRARRRDAEIARHLRLAGRDEPRRRAPRARAAEARRGRRPRGGRGASCARRSSSRPDDAELLLELADVEAWRRHRCEAADALRAGPDARSGRGDPSRPRAPPGCAAGAGSAARRCARRSAARLATRALELLEPPADAAAASCGIEALAGRAWAEAVAGDPDEAERCSPVSPAQRRLAAGRDARRRQTPRAAWR